jgi:hypothetical protein
MSALDLTPIYFVNWRLGEESLKVLTYSGGEFTPTPFASDRVEIETKTVDEINWVGLLIDGEYAAFWNDIGEFSVSALSDSVPTKSVPYVEFMRQADSVPQRIATMTKFGAFGCSGVTENSTPAGEDHFAFTESTSAEPSGFVFGNPIKEIDLWADESGDYLVDENGDLIELGDLSSDQSLWADSDGGYITDEDGRLIEI